MTITKQKLNNVLLKVIFITLFCVAFCFAGVNLNVFALSSDDTQETNKNYTWQYAQYLSLTPQEQSEYGVLPRMYEISSDALYLSASYNALLNSSSALPKEYSLFDIKTMLSDFSQENILMVDKLPQNVGDQRSTNICWAYASLAAFETSLYKMGVVDTSTNLNFSELDLAYTTQVANRKASTIKGGTFDLAYEYLSSEQGPVNQKYAETNTSSLNWSSDAYATQFYAQNFYANREHSGYSALEACYYPSRSSLSESAKQDLRDSIKNHIKTYGAVVASIHMDQSYLYNSMYYNYTGAKGADHAIALVGWDDDISYKLSDGTVYTGAYIAQNSYGTSYGDSGYFYIMYDDINVEENVAGLVRAKKCVENSITYNNMQGTTYDNQFITMGNGYTYYFSSSLTTKNSFVNFYQIKDVDGQYISRIKVPTVIGRDGEQSKFYVYVLNNLTEGQVSSDNFIKDTLSDNYSSKTKVRNINSTATDKYLFTAQQNTFYTVELGEQISLEGDYFAIVVEYTSGSVYFKDNVNDDDGLLSNQKTYISTNNGSSWQYYKGTYSGDDGTVLGTCIMPMYVQTNYSLGTIEYTKNNIDEVYSAKSFSATVDVKNLRDYTILYSLDNQNWSETNYSFTNACDDEYVVYFKIIADFYKTVEDSLTVKISKKDLTITPVEGQFKYYGDYDSTIDHLSNGNIKGESPKFSGKLERVNGNNVGSYLITLGSRKLVDNGAFIASNYNLVFDSSKEFFYQIKPRSLYVEVELSGKIYGEDDPDYFNIIYNNHIEKPKFTGSLKREAGEDIGLYDVYANTISLVDNVATNFRASNYLLVFDEQTNSDKFEILPRSLIVLPNSNMQKIYLESDPQFEFTYSNNVLGETPSFDGALGRVAGEDVGSYSYTIGTLSLVDNGTFKKKNYKLLLSVEDVKFVINYGNLTGCEATSKEVFYDGTAFSLSANSTIESGVNITYSLDQQIWHNGLPQFKDVAEYIIYFKFEKANFNPAIVSATLKIKPYNLFVSPNKNQTKIYGEDDPQIKFSFTNSLLVSETPAYTGGMTRESGENVGEYLINSSSVKLVDNGNFKASNYNLIFDNLQNITFEILPRELVLTPSLNQSKIYGKEDPSLVFEISNTAFGQTALTKGNLTRENGKNVGNYLITLGSVELISGNDFDKNNYTLSFSNSNVYFEIKKADITLKVDDKTSFYSEQVITDYTYVLSGDYVVGDELNIKFFCQVDNSTLKGDYDIKASAENSNYNISIVSGTYHVLYKTYEVRFYALGNYIKTVSVEHFSLINTFDIPTVRKDGYKFSYWKIVNPDTSYKVVDIYEYQVTGDVELTASMELCEYIIYLHTNNQNSDIVEKTYTILDNGVNLDSIRREGHTFIGWYDNEGFEGEPKTQIASGSFGNKNYYAKWSINSYTISLPQQNDMFEIDFMSNSLTQLYNSYFEFKVVLNNAYSQCDDEIEVYLVYNNDTHRDQIYKNELGVYSINNIASDYKIEVENVRLNTYNVCFVADGNEVKTISKNHGETLDISEYPQIPVKQNYNNIPAYWNYDNGILSVEQNTTIEAVYTPNIYNVVIIVDKDKTINKQITYGESIDEDELREELNLNMFEYFVFDKSLNDIDCDSTINAKVESKIYILYIALGVFGALVVFLAVFFSIRKHRNSKFKWWEYAKHSDDVGPAPTKKGKLKK